MAVKPMTGRAFLVLIPLAAWGEVAEVRAAATWIVPARPGLPGMEAVAE